VNNLYEELNQTTHNNNGIEYIKRMMNTVRYAANPQLALEELIRSNPQMRNIITLINQNGGDPKAAFYKLAQEKGVDPEKILSMLR